MVENELYGSPARNVFKIELCYVGSIMLFDV